ncbi:MAG: acylphosphatase [Candidatus Poribacteria bacterium]|nr:acylphosphatase [Candidatus Poribacteria bacterium]MDE0504629.1 acylphosphatase [Candidatus Poribacteria bacterium]
MKNAKRLLPRNAAVKLTKVFNQPMQFHILISGRVQGVGFRDFARRSAEKHGIHGYTKNLGNGDVEIVAEGARIALHEFLVVLEKGPPMGIVDRVRIDERDCDGEYSNFEIRI